MSRYSVDGKTYSSWVVTKEGMVEPVAWVGRDDRESGRSEAQAVASVVATLFEWGKQPKQERDVLMGVPVRYNRKVIRP